MREPWRIRQAAAGIVTRLTDGGEAWPNWEDSAVPPENLADYLRDLYALMAKHELRGIPLVTSARATCTCASPSTSARRRASRSSNPS